MTLDALQTITSDDQAELERRVVDGIYARDYPDGRLDLDDEDLVLNRQAHVKYLHGGLGTLPSGFITLDASRTWICYWITHSLALLGAPLPGTPDRASIIAFLASCQHPEGGFGGGPYQLAHLAPTYAAVSTLVTLGGEDALSVVDRPKLLAFLLRMCVPPEQGGGMTMHEGGEVDVRGCYCALAACEMLGLDKRAVGEACGMVDYIRRCQSHEGGIGGEPWNEAHGGYTFCGLAAAALLGQGHALDLDRLLRWAVRCQGAAEGGFMGRTNKLVDGCYSFWQGGAFPLLAALMRQRRQSSAPSQAAGSAKGAVSGGAAAQLNQVVGSNDDTAATSAGGADRAAVQRILGLLAPDGSDDGSDAIADGGSGAKADTAATTAAAGADGSTPLAEWVARLPHLPPQQAAQRQLATLQAELDAAVEASLDAEDRYKAAVGSAAGGPLQQEALAALERASELQRAFDACQRHLSAISCGAAALLDGCPEAAAAPAGGGAEDDVAQRAQRGPPQAQQEGRLPLLYDAAALQLWLLKCCQAGPRGGLRDKPGKPADYYHTCYCLSGLSSSQHYSGTVLGGERNLLVRADPLCNVVATQLEAAQRYFRQLDGQQ